MGWHSSKSFIKWVGKTWTWSTQRYCIKLFTFLENVLCPHRTLAIEISTLAPQIEVSNSPYGGNSSSLYTVCQLWDLGSLFSVSLPPSLWRPRDPWLQLFLLCAIPLFWHRVSVLRVPQDHDPSQLVLTWLMPKPTETRVSSQRRFMTATENSVVHTGTLKTNQLLLKLDIRNWLNHLKKNSCSSVVTKISNCFFWKELSVQIQAERKASLQ